MKVKPSSNAVTVAFIALIFLVYFSITSNPYSLIPMAIASIYLLTQYLMAMRTIGREAKKIIRIGGVPEIQFALGLSSYEMTFKNKLSTPLYVELRGIRANREGLFIKLTEKSFTLEPKDKRTITIKLMANYQGDYTIEKLKIRMYTANLLFYTDRILKLKIRVRVYPRTYLLIARILTGRGAYGGIIGVPTLKVTRIGWDYYGSRQYVPGDELKFIDWKATARFQKLMIKEFLEESSGCLAVILDLTNPKLSDRGLDRLAEIATLLVNSCHKQRVPIMLALWTGKKFERIMGPTLKLQEVNQMYLTILNVFHQRGRGTPDVEILPIYYYLLVMEVISEGNLSELKRAYELAYERSLKVDADLSAFSRAVVAIVTDLSSPLENLVRGIKANDAQRVVVIVPYPYWRDITNAKAREVAKEYMSKRLNELTGLGVQIVTGKPQKIVRTIARSLL